MPSKSQPKATWVTTDCSLVVSEHGCHIKISAPEGQTEDVLDLAVGHAVDRHARDKSDNLREELRANLVYEQR